MNLKECRQYIYALLIGLMAAALMILQIANPYLINIKIIRMVIYSLTMLVPVMIEMMLGFAGVRLSELAFYFLGFAFYFGLSSALFYFYLKSKRRKRFLMLFGAASVIYLAASLLFLW